MQPDPLRALCERIDALRETLTNDRWHGCVDGSCPHGHANDCTTALIEVIQEHAKEAEQIDTAALRAALEAGNAGAYERKTTEADFGVLGEAVHAFDVADRGALRERAKAALAHLKFDLVAAEQHDRQLYPTAEAYERVCATLQTAKAERDAALARAINAEHDNAEMRRLCQEAAGSFNFSKVYAELQAALARAGEAELDAAKYRWAIKYANWLRHEHCAYVAVPVALEANLDCIALRDAAVTAAMKAQP